MRWLLCAGMLALVVIPTSGFGRGSLTGPRVPGHTDNPSPHGSGSVDPQQEDNPLSEPEAESEPEPPEAQCPDILSVPAPQWELECWFEEEGDKCAGSLTQGQCDSMNQVALRLGLITQEAHDWLTSSSINLCAVVAFNTVIAICPPGCFASPTRAAAISSEGELSWKPDFLSGEEVLPLYVFELSNGNTLRVTQCHGIVLADGRLVLARDVQEGQAFVGYLGDEVVVESIRREVTDLDAYIFRPDVEALDEHGIVADGVLLRDLVWQNELAREVESIRARQ